MEAKKKRPPSHWLLAVPELLEHIFLYSEIRDVLVCTMVCRKWNAVICQSPSLQRHLCFVPDTRCPWNDVQPNLALAESVFKDLRTFVSEQTVTFENDATGFVNLAPDADPEDDSEEDDEDSENNGSPPPIRKPKESPFLAQWHVLDVRYKRSLFDFYDAVPADEVYLRGLRPAYANPEASWRRMLLCQPILGPPRGERAINFEPKLNDILKLLAPEFMPWQGSDCGPWQGDAFAAVAPYLYAGYVAVHGKALNVGRKQGHQVSMRLGWGLQEEPRYTAGQHSSVNFMLNIPRKGLAAHMTSIDLGWKGIKFQQTYPYHPERIDRVRINLEGYYRFLDLCSENAYTVDYRKDPRDSRGYIYWANMLPEWPKVASWYSDLRTPFELKSHLAEIKSRQWL